MFLHLSSFVLLLLTYVYCGVAYHEENKLKNYIITFEANNSIDNSLPETYENLHKSILSTVTKEDGASRHIYSYNKVAKGFAARLSDEEARSMGNYPGCVRVIPANKPLQLTTTHTPHLLGLQGSHGLWKRTKNMGEGIIIGVLDSGIAPGHPSFDDKGMPPPPAKWKGHCDFNSTICNNKLIGAKTMLRAGADEKKHLPPIDTSGHGSHTASTVAGAFVNNVNIFGNAMGKASGVAPRAHLAIYKVCSASGCEPPDILKGFEEAVNDGCDVLSVSIATFGEKIPFYEEPIAVASFYAILNGVFVSAGAGNTGPNASTIANDAPWLLTVAGSHTDRQIMSTVKLGNGLELNGESLYQPNNWTGKMYPLIYLTGNGVNPNVSQCLNGTLDKRLVGGKIVICDAGGPIRPVIQSLNVQEAGGVGIILTNVADFFYYTQADPHYIPCSHVSYADGMKIKEYIRITKNPVGTFHFKGIVYHNQFSPSIAITSARGPSLVTPLTLKPDISAPGVSILAARPFGTISPRVRMKEESKIFYLMSGTSMATPHVSGVAALVKKTHPDWSPSAIKSSIMTTADIIDMNGKPITDHTHSPASAFDMGAGHVDPNKALDPGLVYDINSKDYINYLCSLSYKDADVNSIISPAPPVKCANVKAISGEELNYPSITVSLHGNITTKTIYRTVTSVGKTRKTTYKATISVPRGVSAKVIPSTLKFKDLNEKQSFHIVFKRQSEGGASVTPFGFGELKWVSGRYTVRSPIVVHN